MHKPDVSVERWEVQMMCGCQGRCGWHNPSACKLLQGLLSVGCPRMPAAVMVLLRSTACCGVLWAVSMPLTKQQLSVLMMVLFSDLGLYMNAVEGLHPL